MNIKKQIFPIVGMHCASCKALLEQVVSEVDGVKYVAVNYATEKMTIEYDKDKVNVDTLKNAVKSSGSYELVYTDKKEKMSLVSPTVKRGLEKNPEDPLTEDEKIRQNNYKKLKKKVFIIGFATIPFFIIMLWMGFGIFFNIPKLDSFIGSITIEKSSSSLSLLNIFQFILATPIIFIGGRDILSSAVSALKLKTSNMDTLIALGTIVAWIYSTVVTFFPNIFSDISFGDEVYFEAIVFIIFFIMLGRLLEAKSKRQAAESIKALFRLQAKEALIVRNEKEIVVPIDQVKIGDIIIVKPGQKLPVDGVITEGTTTIDESMITGESLPVEKKINDEVIGATINKSGVIRYKATKIGSDTLLANIIKLVEEAQATEAPIQKIADKVTSVFVPVVITTAFITMIFWLFIAPNIGISVSDPLQMAVYTGITVLIVACPCALGLATPTAIMVGTAQAAQNGILIKDAKALETAHKITTVVFDKTGTLTKGFPEVKALEIESKEYIPYAYSLEKQSHHPLAEAFLRYVEDNFGIAGMKVAKFKDNPGKGISGEIEKIKIYIGTKKYMNEEGIFIPKKYGNKASELKKKAQTVSYIAYAKKVVGVFGVADSIRKDAKQVVQKLHKMNISAIMITGDNKETANAIAKQIGIDEVLGEVLPQDKSEKIKKLQASGNLVAMIGDGINDAPALAQANVGIAMGSGTDVAIATGDIILVKGKLEKAIESIEISKKTMKIIKQNLFWAFAYNSIGIPVAAGILYPSFGVLFSPIIASIAMALSSISVVLNSVRLRDMI